MPMTRYAIDRMVALDVNGSRQRIRLCAKSDGRPPLLVVQAGPGLPLLNEVRKYRRLLDLERDFLVGYWEQRGCGDAPLGETAGVTIQQQVADVRTVVRWFFEQTNQRVILLGISMGGTFALHSPAGRGTTIWCEIPTTLGPRIPGLDVFKKRDLEKGIIGIVSIQPGCGAPQLVE